jgi:hypothetical protein
MTFNELTSRIDREIAEKKMMDKNIWFDINISITGIKNQLIKYYRDRGYTIDLAICKSCQGQGQVADVTITWNKG